MNDLLETTMQEHAIWATFEDLRAAASETLADLELDSASTAVANRTLAVTTHLEERLKQTPPTMVIFDALSGVQSQLVAAAAELRAFVGDRNLSRFTTVNTQLDNAIKELAWVESLSPRSRADIAQKTATRVAQVAADLEASVKQKLQALSIEVDGAIGDLRSRGTSISSEIQQAIATLNTLAAATHQDVAAAQAQLVNDSETHKVRLDAYFEQQQTAHLKTEQDRAELFKTTVEQAQTASKEELESLSSRGQAEVAKLSAEGGRLVTQMEEYDQAAREILGVTAALGAAETYVIEAQRQSRIAMYWTGFNIATFLSATALSVISITVWSPFDGGISAETAVEYSMTRLPVLAALATMFAWAQGQLNEHRKREGRAKRLAMELTSFRPFLAELDATQREGLIKAAVPRYFPGDGHGPELMTDPS